MACVVAACADPATTEVVVVVNGSDDDTAEQLRSATADDARIRVLEVGAAGAAAARHAGAAAATGDIVLMIDDDVVLTAGAVTGHARWYADGERNRVVVGYLQTMVPPQRQTHRFTTEIYAREYERHITRWDSDPDLVLSTLWGGNVSMRRDLSLLAGAKAADFPDFRHNDRALGIQLRNLGAHAVFDRRLVAEHHHTRSFDAFLRDAYQQGAGRRLLHARHATEVDAPFDPRSVVADLPGPTRRVVMTIADTPKLHRLVLATGRGVVTYADRFNLRSVERATAKLLRRVELVRGATADHP